MTIEVVPKPRRKAEPESVGAQLIASLRSKLQDADRMLASQREYIGQLEAELATLQSPPVSIGLDDPSSELRNEPSGALEGALEGNAITTDGWPPQ